MRNTGWTALPLFLVPMHLVGAEVDYATEIQPILAEHCFHCHGTDEGTREAGLRLDVREVAIAKGENHEIAIVPGDPDASELIKRITSHDPEMVMPPEEGEPLEEADIEKLRQWISEGAPYAEHWAFVPPTKVELTGKGHPIDQLVERRIAREGLKLSPTADAGVLCRRIYLDLVGVPPSTEELDQFEQEAARDLDAAVASLLERLLDRPAFGEKWARHWLDVARYSDSNGFEKDLPREMWAWRDWVVDAINADQPYDRFLIEQLAGDLLPDATQDQLIASGFLRNGMINEEGAIVPEQFRIEGLFDQMDTIGKATFGLSLQCAQCHTHKFDPISHDEYFGLFAFFNDTYESQSWVYTDEQQAELLRVRSAVASIESELRSANPDWIESMAQWEAAIKDAAAVWEVLDTDKQIWDGGLNHPEELADHSILVLGHRTNNGLLYLEAEPELDGVTGLRFEGLRHQDLPFGGPGRSPHGTYALTEIKLEVQAPGSETWEPVAIKNATADFTEAPRPVEDRLYAEREDKEVRRQFGPPFHLIDGEMKTGWRPERGPVLRHTDSVVVMELAEPLTRPEGTRVKVHLVQTHGARGDGRNNEQTGRFRLSLSHSPEPKAPPLDHEAWLAMQVPVSQRTAAQKQALFRAWRLSVADFTEANDRIATLEKQYPEAETSVLHLGKRRGSERRRTQLLDRGAWNKPTHEVKPHVPAVFPPLEAEDPDRLDLARWITSRESPLVARVQVNRVWQAVFGMGIVETAEDFGVRTRQPEHLELLDWLAVDFMEQGWSLKKLLRTILTSRTYLQDSRANEEQMEMDPRNVFLARGPRFRMDGEVIRDVVLKVAGLLHEKEGGPSVYPPVPQSVLDFNFVRPKYWEPPIGPERYRRSLYLFRKRSMPDPVLSSFDAPTGDASCARRLRSNSPLSSLVSLNEPVFVEAARGFALRVLEEGGADDAERASHAFRLCTGRSPSEEELREILAFLEEQRSALPEDEATLLEIIAVDSESPARPAPQVLRERALWTIVGRVLINLDETLTKY